MSSPSVDAVRHFNRFYTRQIGLLHETLLKSPFSLTEVRVLYELAARDTATASELNAELGLDAGYLSRLLQGFEKDGLIRKRRSAIDGRAMLLSLTAKGKRTFLPLNESSNREVAGQLDRLSEADRDRLVDAMHTIEELLGDRQPAPVVLRPHQPGDIGWVIQAHAEIYAAERGWQMDFEALVAEIAAKFVREFDPVRERCWIAEQNGRRLGSVFLVKASETVAKLRLLIVDPRARGLGLGWRLVDECVRFARQAGYRKMTLWTNRELTAARHLYERAGFRMVQEMPETISGKIWTAEVWDLDLVDAESPQAVG